jgi:NitT/TauT family transport system substrate-binding protein
VVFWQEGLYTETFNLVVTQEFAQANPKVIERIIRSVLRAEEFIGQNRHEAIRIVADVTGLDSTILENTWDNYDFRIDLGPSLIEYLRVQGDWAKSSGSAPAAAQVPDYRSFVYSEGLQKVRPSRVTYR